MTRAEKTAVIEELKSKFESSQFFYVADSSTLPVEKINKLRGLFFEKGIPSTTTWLAYFGFFSTQIIFAAILPGLTMYGLPTSPHGKRLPYHCNGYLAYYFSIIISELAYITYRIFNGFERRYANRQMN